jgi:hypothetical protein
MTNTELNAEGVEAALDAIAEVAGMDREDVDEEVATAAIRAYLTVSPIEAPGQDMVMVPREPTLAMSIAGEAEYTRKGLGVWSDFHAIYRAMIEAAIKGAPNASK